MTGVALGYVHGDQVAYSWHRSVRDLVSSGQVSEVLATRYGTGGIVEARNQTVAQLLAGGTEWLFWVDTDMGFDVQALDRLLGCEVPMVGALTFAAKEVAPDGLGGWHVRPAPVLFRLGVDPHTGETRGFAPWLDYPRDQLVPVAATGSACVLVHRDVLQAVHDDLGGPRWYDPMRSEATGNLVSEDLAFCARVVRLGIPIHVHTGVVTSHQKTVWISEPDYTHPGGGG